MSIPIVDAQGEPAHLLIVDDDDRIRDLLRKFLSKGGARVSVAQDADAARRMLGAFSFDVIILDITMPKEDGFSLAESIRKTSQAPIIMLTALTDHEHLAKGYAVGTDDYMSKPFEPAELALRINAILRRVAAKRGQTIEQASFGPFVFNVARGDLTRDGKGVRLTDSELTLLKVLVAKGGEPITREDLARRTGAGLERSIDVQVTRLRRKIEADPRAPIFLQTVRGVGYRLAID
ncbi:MAG: response regulator [Caulobacterales bacterium]|jgi:two-component system phosphate regulon response regulator OmpR